MRIIAMTLLALIAASPAQARMFYPLVMSHRPADLEKSTLLAKEDAFEKSCIQPESGIGPTVRALMCVSEKYRDEYAAMKVILVPEL